MCSSPSQAIYRSCPPEVRFGTSFYLAPLPLWSVSTLRPRLSATAHRPPLHLAAMPPGASPTTRFFQTAASYPSSQKSTTLILISQLLEVLGGERICSRSQNECAVPSVCKTTLSGAPGPLQTQTSGHLGLQSRPLSNCLPFTVEATHLPTSCPLLPLGWGCRQVQFGDRALWGQ